MSDADVERCAASAGGKTMGSAANSYRPSTMTPEPWRGGVDVVDRAPDRGGNVAVFVGIMYVNDCSGHRNPCGSCVAGFLGRFSFQSLRENRLFGPSSST
ncbi:hypothetical protein B296_00039804 [Ensete ventricosum]|uniref:Uncharacterized protein n=1 Tax=Ensete ventricosum TaxID=4639 RepID=A0A426X1Y4_ENSVE|nr:hypothetical protein B296_00039804 [Ensete ventricosum]